MTMTTTSTAVLLDTGQRVDPRRWTTGEQSRAASVEHIDPEAGTILMRAVPYDVETELTPGLWESFAPETFARAATQPSRCKLWHEHGGPLIGHALDVEDRPDGAWIRAKFSNTAAGQEARELAHDGSLDQVSITFRPMADWMKATRKPDGTVHVRHSRAALMGVALVAHGAYGEHAHIASVRDNADTAQRAREAALARLRSLQA